jgi:hypothetical protein
VEYAVSCGFDFNRCAATAFFSDHDITFVLQAYVDLVRAWNWRSFTIIYENNEGLVRLQELLKAHGPSEFPIAVRQLGEGTDYRYVAL